MVGRNKTKRVPNAAGCQCLVAIAGASGAGKTWLASRLEETLAPRAGRLSLDDFYRDRSHLSASRRGRLNFDHPRAIDWPEVEKVLNDSFKGDETHVPAYDFSSHSRNSAKSWVPKPVVLVDGLWLLRRRSIRNLFNLRIFIECAPALCQKRRLERDVRERGRSPRSVRKQFRETVLPMQTRYVTPQARWADLVLRSPLNRGDVETVTRKVEELLEGGIL